MQTAELIITRVFDAPRELIFQYWTDPEYIKKWWGPTDYTCPLVQVDLRVGGKYLNCMRDLDGKDYWSTGEYRKIDPPEKLVFTDSFSDEKGNVVSAESIGMRGDWPLELLVTVTLEEQDGNTLMTLIHVGIPPEMLADCKIGWDQSFDKIDENLESL